MSKLNTSLMVTTIILFLVSGFSIYFAFSCWQDEKIAKEKITTLTVQIDQLNKNIEKNNQVIADNELSKRELENQSLERQEQINEQLKDNDCAKQFVPMPVSASLYNRAKNIRK
ncbi:hypothetical protein J3U11_11190 [Gilliamella sp. B2840]|uniref:hypothetical protein n=1 Tax=unclassified Gilliamella TaxID=2685620 RepID=UPI00226A1F33|nr:MULTISPECIES: hypothetical protein [unclassified Gilliamella]MCX8665969.1 hypothetical protein [Gilliamella sp. B2887]MCX8696549.1 hypothetical protein [Gilliamella sp. B2828]MCX8698293.1 hypothetical protein [Gilliamella sp. B3000]MCX8701638.1 hypothetical protein [Gilliamella sp. B2840]